MSSTPKRTGYGDVKWTGHFWNGFNGPRNARGNLYLMTYQMVGALDRKHQPDYVDDIEVTNGTCAGKGWDVLVCGDVVQHCEHKSEAQAAAEELT
jgi:hypothetical protein